MSISRILGARKLIGNPLGYFIPGYGVGKAAVKWTNLLKANMPYHKAMGVLKRACYRGKGLFSDDMNKVVKQIGSMIPGVKGEMLKKMPNIGVDKTFKLQDAMAREAGEIRRRVGDLLYSGTKYNWKDTQITSNIKESLGNFIPKKKTGEVVEQLRGTLMSSRERARDVLNIAETSKNLIGGPSLASNMAVLAIPTIASIYTTKLAYLYARRKIKKVRRPGMEVQ